MFGDGDESPLVEVPRQRTAVRLSRADDACQFRTAPSRSDGGGGPSARQAEWWRGQQRSLHTATTVGHSLRIGETVAVGIPYYF